MQGPCEHCGNADKSKWTSQCLYKGSYPSRRAFVLSTFDPPCSIDQYDEEMRVRDRESRAMWFLTALIVVPVFLFLFS